MIILAELVRRRRLFASRVVQSFESSHPTALALRVGDLVDINDNGFVSSYCVVGKEDTRQGIVITRLKPIGKGEAP